MRSVQIVAPSPAGCPARFRESEKVVDLLTGLAQLLASADQRSSGRVALSGSLSGREPVPSLQQLRQRGRGAQRRVEQRRARPRADRARRPPGR